MRYGAVQVFRQTKAARANPFDDAARQFIRSVTREVRIVGQFLVLSGESICRIVNECPQRSLRPQRLKQRLAAGIQVDDGQSLLFTQLAHGVGVIPQRVHDAPLVVESATMHGRDQHGRGSLTAGLFDVFPKPLLIGSCGIHVGGAGLLVVMRELNEEVVARVDRFHDLSEAFLADKTLQRLARLGVIGDHNAALEEARKHLAPGRPGLTTLVGDRRVARQVHGDGRWIPAERQGPHAGMRVAEFHHQTMVPIEVILLVVLEPYGLAARQFAVADVDAEGPRHGSAGRSLYPFNEQASRFGIYGGERGSRVVAEFDKHIEVALGHVCSKAPRAPAAEAVRVLLEISSS